jgi:hypothetical protein
VRIRHDGALPDIARALTPLLSFVHSFIVGLTAFGL